MSHFELHPVSTAEGMSATVRGEVDLDSSPELWERLRELLDARPARLVLDLAGVRYIDSSGVAVLIQARKQADRQRVDLVLKQPSRKVVDVLDLAQLTPLFQIEESAS